MPNIKAFDDFCYKVNFFKTPFTFHFTSKRQLISSKLGTILTIAILMYLVNEIFLGNMYQKTNPSIINQKFFPSNRPKIQFNRSNFELAFGILDMNMNTYELDETIFNVSLIKKIKKINFKPPTYKPTIEINESLYKNFHVCNNISDLKLSKAKPFSRHIMCLDEINLETLGYFDEPEFLSFRLELKFCDNTTSKKPCQSMEKMIESTKNKSFAIHYIDYNINFNNFSDPITVTSQAHYMALDYLYYKEEIIFLSNFEFLDDSNILKNDPKITKGFSKNSISREFAYQENKYLNETFATFTFYSGQETLQYTRTYQKLSELLSSIGGSASLFISIGFIFMNFVNEWTLRMALFKTLYEIREDMLNKKLANQTVSPVSPMSPREILEIKKESIDQNTRADMFFKIEMKVLKEDSAVLEKFAANENLGPPKVKQKKRFEIKFANHFLYLIKKTFCLKLNENDLKYQYLDRGHNLLMNGLFIYKKIQELELLKKVTLTEKEVSLIHSLKKPKIYFSSEHLKKNIINNNEFGLYPIEFYDNEVQKSDLKTQNDIFEEIKKENSMFEKRKEK